MGASRRSQVRSRSRETRDGLRSSARDSLMHARFRVISSVRAQGPHAPAQICTSIDWGAVKDERRRSSRSRAHEARPPAGAVRERIAGLTDTMKNEASVTRSASSGRGRWRTPPARKRSSQAIHSANAVRGLRGVSSRFRRCSPFRHRGRPCERRRRRARDAAAVRRGERLSHRCGGGLTVGLAGRPDLDRAWWCRSAPGRRGSACGRGASPRARVRDRGRLAARRRRRRDRLRGCRLRP